MKTKELIKKVVGDGFVVVKGCDYIEILKDFDGHESLIARVNTKHKFMVNTVTAYFKKLSTEQQDRLFNLLFIYANTTLEERQEEKKYYIVMQEINDTHKFLNFNKLDKKTILSTRTETLEYQTRFTKSEIEQYGLQKFAGNELFELVEVNDD